MDCLTCKSISGEKRISPGPTIHEARFWYIEHAYPCKLKGWLVLVLKRHVEALHDLTQEEFLELGELQFRLSRLLSDELKAAKILAMLKVNEQDAVPPGEIKALCDKLKAGFEQAL